MSTIYISEPPTCGKMILVTSCGEIEIELWSKEAPLACRNFVQLCLEGYYDGSIFHRVVRKFILQGGDPSGTGRGGESVFGRPFKMEIHSRLRFNRRGLLAMHCSNGEVEGSQFFFTLNSTPELQNNYTIFGTVVGNTVFNMLTLSEGLIDKETERPHDPQMVLSAKIISNPFSDIIPRVKVKEEEPKRNVPAVKDFGLLSFMDNLDEDDDINDDFKVKTKSAHDFANNANLSTETVRVDPNESVVFKSSEVELTVVVHDKSKESDEKKAEIRRMKAENLKLQKEIANTVLKERVSEKVEINVEIDSKNISKREDSLVILKGFAEKLKNSTNSDWFYKPVEGTDEVESKVYDPEVYNPEKYDLFDPRNPLNQRKRQADDVTPQGSKQPKQWK